MDEETDYLRCSVSIFDDAAFPAIVAELERDLADEPSPSEQDQ